ncbi:MAG TPA: surface lipoprotein assembly modifier [Burkholderiales bacterium]|nr:surface lipoprotein assembly modifier [Burkholderiales bacterium]
MNKKSACRALLCAIVMAVSGLAWAQDATLDRARQLIQAKQYRQAFQLLEPHEQARAGDPAYDYLLGIAAIDSGELTRGVFALERVLAVNPNHAQARAEIARAYFLMGENKVARQEFEQVKQARPPAEVSATIDRFLDALDARERSRGTGVTGYLEASVGYDSNVNAATSTNQFAIPALGGGTFNLAPGADKQGDAFFGLAGGISGRYGFNETWGLVGTASFDRRLNDDHSDFDTGVYNVSGGLSARADGNEFLLALQGQRYEIDNDRFRDAKGIVGQWRRAVNGNNELSAYVQHTRLKYPDVSIRNATRTVFGGAWAHAYGGPRSPVVFIGAYFGEEDEMENTVPQFGHDLWGFRVGGQVGLTDRLLMTATIGYEDRNYHGPDPFFLRERHDEEVQLRIALPYSISRHWSVIPALAYTNVKSNIVISDYERAIVSLTARYDFR